jgi:polar amino acid transport system substrate-binding protein/glutamate/aspartate transport system substrate-binding protein
MMSKRSLAALSLPVLGVFALVVLALSAFSAPAEAAGTLDRLRQDKTLRIAYRPDAPPFSYQAGTAEPQGFIVEICRAVAKSLTQQLELPSLNIVYVPVTAENRFDAIKDQKADLLCEATTATLSRREVVDFSIPTFVDGASLLIRTDGPQSLQAMAGRKIGVLGGTTTQEALQNSLKDENIAAEVMPAKSHEEGLAMLDAGTISAYFGDRAILQSLIKQSKDPKKLLLADNYLTVEPYALAEPLGDEDFRLAVDRALSHLYRNGDIGAIFAQSFPDGQTPSGILKTLYLITGLPD